MQSTEKQSSIGRRIPKVDARSKALGEAKFATDIYFPRMLHARILRSNRPHARIRQINVEKARRLPGVKAVITAVDVPDKLYGNWIADMPIFAREKVRYIGDPVAAVAATDDDTACEALELIRVEYEEIPAVFDPFEAMLPGSPIVHEHLGEYLAHFFRGGRSMTGNVNYNAFMRNGDVEAGFADSDLVLEETFTTPKVHPTYLEPHASVAAFDSDGRVTVWTTTQRPHLNQAIVASLLGLPASKIRVIPCYVGGGYGGKTRTLSEPTAVALAQRASAPVRLVFSREEELTASTTRHAATVRMKMGAKRDGTLVACQAHLVFDTGAYAQTINAAWLGALTAVGPYRVPHVDVEVFGVYTNKIMSGAFRGYGTPQVNFARESLIDSIADALQIDPVDLRLKNCFRPGDFQPTGHKLASVNVEKTILEAAKKIEWNQQTTRKRAFGIASGFTPCGGLATSCLVRVNQDGTVVVSSGTVDMGQGLKTVFAQIVAEELCVKPDDVTVLSGDTESTPFDVGIFEDRGTHTGGLAAKMAAEDARAQILEMAAEDMGVDQRDLYLEDKKVFVKSSPGTSLPLHVLLARGMFKKGRPVVGRARINPDTPSMDSRIAQGETSRLPSTYTFATHSVEVEMDPTTGQLTVVRAVGAQDCGAVINPDGVEGQIDGGMATALGYGLFEEMLIEDGQVLNPNLLEYKIPTALDMPAMSGVVVESYDQNGPFGAKGVGNSVVVNLAPAIANAVYKGCGVRIKDLPVTPEKLLKGLEEKGD